MDKTWLSSVHLSSWPTQRLFTQLAFTWAALKQLDSGHGQTHCLHGHCHSWHKGDAMGTLPSVCGMPLTLCLGQCVHGLSAHSGSMFVQKLLEQEKENSLGCSWRLTPASCLWLWLMSAHSSCLEPQSPARWFYTDSPPSHADWAVAPFLTLSPSTGC